jgi:hypothetical protein
VNMASEIASRSPTLVRPDPTRLGCGWVAASYRLREFCTTLDCYIL